MGKHGAIKSVQVGEHTVELVREQSASGTRFTVLVDERVQATAYASTAKRLPNAWRRASDAFALEVNKLRREDVQRAMMNARELTPVHTKRENKLN